MSLLRSLASLGTCVVMVFSLFGCGGREPTYSYLMLHPDYLQRAYNQCVEEVVEPALPCEIIMRAQADFTALINQREQDPERFGARVLQEQENSVFLKTKFAAAWQAYRIVGASKPKLEDLKKMRIELDKTEKDYRLSVESVNILLTVIAATSAV